MLNKLEYTCPTCGEHYVLYESGVISPQKYAKIKAVIDKQVKLGYCKNCHRKDPDIPTTLEMDGLFSKDDIINRYALVYQCRKCKKWTVHNNHSTYGKNSYLPCTNCGSTDYDPTSVKSLRTYNPETDNKRKPKVKK